MHQHYGAFFVLAGGMVFFFYCVDFSLGASLNASKSIFLYGPHNNPKIALASKFQVETAEVKCFSLYCSDSKKLDF
jgi:hypothetical protein